MTIEEALNLGMYIMDRQEYYGHVDRYLIYTEPGVVLFCEYQKRTYLLGSYNTEEEALKKAHCAYHRMLSIHDGTLFHNLEADLLLLYPCYQPTPDDWVEHHMWNAWNVPYKQAYPEWRV